MSEDDGKKKKKGFFSKAFGLKSKEEKLAEAAALKAEQAAEVDRQMAERMAAINAAALKSAREQDEASGDAPDNAAEKARIEAEERKQAEAQALKDVETAKRLAEEKRLAAEKAKADAEAKAKELEEKAKELEAKRIADEKAEAERVAKEKAEAEAEAARAKAAQEAAAKAEAERIAAEKERLKVEAQAAAQAEKERIKAEKEAAKLRAAEEKAEAKRKAREEKERLKAEKAAFALAKKEQGKAEAQALKLRQEKERAERLAAEKAEEERLEAERVAAAHAEAEKQAAEAERLAAEQMAAEQAEAEARAAQQEQERLAAEREKAEEAARAEAEARDTEAKQAAHRETQKLAEQDALKAEEERAAAQAEITKAEEEQAEAERLEKEAQQRADLEAEKAEMARIEAEKAASEKPAEDQPKRKGFFSRITEGLKKSSNRMADSVSTLFNKRKLDADALEELEDLLIASDLGVGPAMRVTESLAKDKFDKQVTAMEIKIALADVIAETLKPLEKPLVLGNGNPEIVLFVGVNGSGKTTTLGKIAKRYTDQGKKVLIAAGDTFRAAAVEQLKVWGERANAPVISAALGADASGLVYDAITKAKTEKFDILMIDTAGRLQNRTELMDELSKIVRVIKKQDETAPHHSILVLDATVGQNALLQTEAFLATAGITGLIMTKLDGTAKGGVLVALADKFKLPIHSIGIGERIEDLENFSADVFAAALSGVADAVIDQTDT